MWRIVSAVVLMLVFTSEAANLRHERHRRESSDCPKNCTGRPLQISFVVDGSASIWPDNFTLGLNFIEDFVDIFEIAAGIVQVSVITFGDRVYEEDRIDFGDYNNNVDLKKAISTIPYRSGSSTNTGGGILYMVNHQLPDARPNVRHVVVVMTDGNSQESDKTKQAAELARNHSLEVFAIGVGQNVSAQELHNIASDDRHVFVVAKYDMLEGIKKRLAYEACDVPTFPECEMDPVDLSFVIDSSASIEQGNFTIGMRFVRDFVDSFLVNPTAVRVSAVTFGKGVYEQDAFNFDAYPDKKDLLDAIESIEWRYGTRTDTGKGINHMRLKQMIHNRTEAAHVCIVITDGASQEKALTASEAKSAQDAGIVMYAVGVGQLGVQLDEEELQNIAGNSARVLTADNYAQLNLLKTNLTNAACDGILSSLSGKAERYRL